LVFKNIKVIYPSEDILLKGGILVKEKLLQIHLINRDIIELNMNMKDFQETFGEDLIKKKFLHLTDKSGYYWMVRVRHITSIFDRSRDGNI
jgi:hypothetical protein